jgi:predicted SnoaL-like aldol condensation-catalyzing enzyme
VNLKALSGALMFMTCISPMLAQSGSSINPPTVTQTAPMNASEQKNLDMVLQWWREVIEAHHTEFAEKYMTEEYIQHNPNVPTGRAAVVKMLSGMPPINPIPEKLSQPPVVAGARGDFVWLVFEQLAKDPHDPAKTYHYNSVDLLRIQNGKVEEHWDSEKLTSGSPGFVPSSAPAPSTWNTGKLSTDEKRGIGLATQELKDMFQYGHLELADKIMDPGYIQHNPNVPQGREGFKQFMGAHSSGRSEEIKPEWKSDPALTLADGPYVLMMWNVDDKDPSNANKTYTWNHFDLLRIENGVVKEHWDEAKIEPTKVMLDATVLSNYIGRYALSPDFIVAITLEDGHLAAQATGQPKLALAAESNTMFFLENADLGVEFVKEGTGKVTGLIVHQGGQDMKAAKL